MINVHNFNRLPVGYQFLYNCQKGILFACRACTNKDQYFMQLSFHPLGE